MADGSTYCACVRVASGTYGKESGQEKSREDTRLALK
jgi:hypothetical protein